MSQDGPSTGPDVHFSSSDGSLRMSTNQPGVSQTINETRLLCTSAEMLVSGGKKTKATAPTPSQTEHLFRFTHI